MRRLLISSLILLPFGTMAGTLSAESREIYRRAELIETRTGVVDVRVVFGPRLEIPVSCDEGIVACKKEVTFSRLYSLDFALETRSLMDGAPRVERDERGSVYLALQFDDEDQELFDDELRNYLASLGADVFTEDYARLEHSEPIITTPMRSVTPSWSCFRNGDSGKIWKYWRTLETGSDGKEQAASHTYTGNLKDFDEHGLLCDEMAEATRDAYPDEIRTMPTPRKVEEVRVRLEEGNSIREEAYAEELTPLPDGASFTRKDVLDKNWSTTTSRNGDGSSAKATWVVQKERWTISLAEADISPDVVQNNVWLTRWELETVERSFGPDPVDRILSVSTLTIALLATLPPVRLDQNDVPVSMDAPIAQVPIRLDDDAFLAELGKTHQEPAPARFRRRAH